MVGSWCGGSGGGKIEDGHRIGRREQFFAQFLRIFRVFGHVLRLSRRSAAIKATIELRSNQQRDYNKRFCIDTESVNTLFYQNAPSSSLF
jgi:hypothetical protein